MKFNKGIFTVFVLFLIFFICLGSAYASEESQGTGENNPGNVGVAGSNPVTPLNAGEGNYTTLKSEVGSGGNVNLSRSSYKWVDGDGDGTIVITTPGVIDGKGAVIDMQGSLSMRIFDVECGGVTFKNITFKNAFYKDDGGAVYFKENGDLINCSFNGNRAVLCSGGAVFFQKGGNVINCSFDGNRADNSGGAIFCFNVVNVTNCSFTDNYADVGHGGAVCFNEEGSVSGCNFTGNYVTQHRGGAVYFYGSGSVSGCNFMNNYANQDDGGAVYFYGSGNVSGCSFTGNYVWNGDGGAVCFYGSGNVSGCNFTDNEAYGTGDGGAIFFKGTGSVSGCSFTWNRAHSGGAVYFYGSGNVSGCNFMSHIAQNFGGAVYFNGSGSVSGCNFTGNWATMDLGGAVCFNKEGSVSGCNFTLNLVGGNGGAVYFSGYGSSNVSGCNFMLNQAKMDGGAILMSLGSVENCSFYANRADNIGGAVYCGESNVSGCNFMNNYAGNGGGAFYMDDASLSSVQDSIFINNTQYPIFVYTNEMPVNNSWFGNNATNYDTRPEAGQGVNFLNWLFLNASADSSAVSVFDSSDINFKLYSYNETSSQKILPYDNSRLMPVNLTITSTNGDVNESVINFGGSVKYRATNGGRGSVTASIENVACTIGFDNIKIDPNLSIDSPVITYGENGTISLDYNPNATGKVNITLTGKKYNKNYENLDLNATITLSGEILPDVYNVAVKYSGDGNFTNATAFGILTVNYLDSDMKVVGFDINVTDSKALMFRVTLPLNATGILNISNGSSLDVSKSGRKENNTLIIDIFNNAYAVGEYNWTFTYWDDDIYANSSANAVSNILIVKTEIIPLNATIDLYAGSSSKINYTLSPNGFTTDITFSSNDTGVVYVDSISGEIKAISAGSAVISIDFAGNANYTKSNATVTVNVKAKENLTISATADPIVIGENATVVVTGFEDATGNMSVRAGDGLYVANITKGTASVVIPGLIENTKAEVHYGGDYRYNGADTSIVIIVKKVVVLAPDLVKYYHGPEVFVVNVTYAKTEPIAGKPLNITINGVTYNRTTDANGIASLGINLNSGVYDAVTRVDDITVYSLVTVLPTVNASDVQSKVKNVVFTAAFLDSEGNYLSNGTKVSFNVGGVIYNSSVVGVKGLASVDLILDNGRHVITSYNLVSGEYCSNVISVDLKDVDMSLSGSTITVGENATITVSLPNDATGNVSVSIKGKPYLADVSGGAALIVIPGLSAGNYTFSVVYSGDYRYNGATGDVNVTVSKVANVTIVVDAPAITVGENATVTVALPGDATGSVLIGEENVTLKSGVAGAIISGLPVGVNTVSIVYSGDDKYCPADTVANVVVNEKPIPSKENLTIVATACAINVGEDAVIVVTGFKNATGNVSASIGSGLYSAIIVNGAANITVSGLNDNVTAFVSYAGDDRYNPADISVNITVYGIIVNAPELTKYYRSSEKFVVNVTDAKGQAISNKSVDITVNGVTYHRTTNAEGTASLSINLNSGEYAVVVAVDDVKVDSAVIVKATIDASDVVKVFRNATQYYATFLDVNGTPTPNVKVSFNINGVIYNRTTDANGAAKLNINLDAGEYILTATNTETGEMKSNIINVISLIESSDLTKYYKNDSQFVVRIHTSDGGYVGAGEEVTFNINGIFYTRTTNATGHAKLNINLGAGNYTVTTCYKNCGRSNNIVVLPVLNTSDLVMKYMDGSQFKAELVDAVGNPYPKQSVDFNINGVLYNRTTDSSGVAKLNIRLMPGVYIITSSFNGCNVANNITVTA